MEQEKCAIFNFFNFHFSLCVIYRNGSGSREVTTLKPQHHGRSDISASGQQDRVPVPPTMNDKYVDLMALLLGHIDSKTPANFDKVIIKNDLTDDLNPSMADILEIKMR